MFHEAEKKEVLRIEQYNFREDMGVKGFIQWSEAFCFNMLHLLEGPTHGLSNPQMRKLAENALEIMKDGPKSIEEVPIYEYFKRVGEDLKPYMDKKIKLMPPKEILDNWLALAELSLSGIDLIKVAREMVGSDPKFAPVLIEADSYFTQLDGIYNDLFEIIRELCKTLLTHDLGLKKVKNLDEEVSKEIERLFPTDGSLYPY